MEAVMTAVAIVAAYLIGRIREHNRWRKQRREAFTAVTHALEARKESRRAFDVQMDVIRHQRELLQTFAQATDLLHKGNDDTAWSQLEWAAHRVNTETI